FPGSGTAITGRDQLAAAGISPGVMKPFDVLVENNGNAEEIAAKVAQVPGIAAAVAPPSWHRGADSLVQPFPPIHASTPGIQGVIDRVNASLAGTEGSLGGTPVVDRDFTNAIYDNFPYLLLFVLVLTFILLSRAFRSIVLALKAVVLNLLSL